MTYILRDCDTGAERECPRGTSLARARKLAHAWAHDSDSEVTRTCWIDTAIVRVQRGAREIVDYVTTTIDPAPPACTRKRHRWSDRHDLVGGLRENPGVWGHGGGVKTHTQCTHCGARRIVDTWATRPDTGQQGLTSTEYRAGSRAE